MNPLINTFLFSWILLAVITNEKTEGMATPKEFASVKFGISTRGNYLLMCSHEYRTQQREAAKGWN